MLGAWPGGRAVAKYTNDSGELRRRAVMAVTLVFTLLSIARADTPPATDAAKSGVDSATVIAARDRATIERNVRTFVNAIAVKPGDESLARWRLLIAREISMLS